FEPDPSHVPVIRTDGTGRRLLGFGRRPLWSPDGSRIAYTTFPNERSRAAVAVTRPNGHPRALTRDRRRRDDVLAAWAPNGKSLLYDSGDYGLVGLRSASSTCSGDTRGASREAALSGASSGRPAR